MNEYKAIISFEEEKHCMYCPFRTAKDDCTLQYTEMDDPINFDWEAQMEHCPLVLVKPTMANTKKNEILVRGKNKYRVIVADEEIFVVGKFYGNGTNYNNLEAYSNDPNITTLGDCGFAKEMVKGEL